MRRFYGKAAQAHAMNVIPLRPHVRYFCSACDQQYHQHESPDHRDCIDCPFCPGCGRAFAPGDADCPACGSKRVNLARASNCVEATRG